MVKRNRRPSEKDDAPERLLMVSCPECDYRRTSDDLSATRVRVGGESCPECGYTYGPYEAINAFYIREDRVFSAFNRRIEELREEHAEAELGSREEDILHAVGLELERLREELQNDNRGDSGE